MGARTNAFGYVLSWLLVVRPYVDGRHALYKFNLFHPLTYVIIPIILIIGLVETAFSSYTVKDILDELHNLCTGKHIPDSYRAASVSDLVIE